MRNKTKQQRTTINYSVKMSTTGRNASDVGLIVQGTLIFLSAVVAVLGYLVQSKLKRKEEKLASERQHDAEIRQLKLQNRLMHQHYYCLMVGLVLFVNF